ncbi:endonuclease [Bacteroidales bacterium OttesenSCG-928-B11]|nr:endonuclease [Bacteroidales bacterium OttesenSCG-928-B11]
MEKNLWIIVVLFCHLSVFAQIPAGYYNQANGKSGRDLQQTLSGIIDNHNTVSYSSLWQHFQQTDTKEGVTVWDIYSDNPADTNAYDFVIYDDQCGQVGSGEGHCYNREHTFCQSWFGGGTGAPYSDLFHIYPVDGYINSTRNNYPYGIVISPTRTFSNGSKYGSNQAAGAPSTNAFEPIDEYKGDIARSFFYMATRYMFEDGSFLEQSPMTFKSQLQPWALELFMNWHLLDPVNDKERNRNNAVYAIQQNRNPFIDYPELIGKIWSADSIHPFILDDTATHDRPKIDCFAVKTLQILQLHIDKPMIESTIVNPANYTIQSGNSVESIQYIYDTIYLHLENPLQNGKNYHLIVRNLLAENQYFIKDTSISFMAGMPQDEEIVAMWTFDALEGKPNVPTQIKADVIEVGFATLYMDGSYTSSAFSTSGTNAQLDAFAGTTIGDPRGATANASRSLAITGEQANQNAVVFAFGATGYSQFNLTFACRRTASGFSEHLWEWSIDGDDYQVIDNSNTSPQSVGEFELMSLNLQTIEPLNVADTIYLRLTVDGATSATGNNRFDNVVVHAAKSSGINNYSPQNRELSFNIYPNPAGNVITVEIFGISSSCYQMRCYDLRGKLVCTKHANDAIFDVDFSFLEQGIYIIEIIDENERISAAKKLMIRK